MAKNCLKLKDYSIKLSLYSQSAKNFSFVDNIINHGIEELDIEVTTHKEQLKRTQFFNYTPETEISIFDSLTFAD